MNGKKIYLARQILHIVGDADILWHVWATACIVYLLIEVVYGG